jgi:hypothetical protein
MKINVASIWNHHHPNLMNNGTAKIGPNGHFVPSKQKFPQRLAHPADDVMAKPRDPSVEAVHRNIPKKKDFCHLILEKR